MNSYNVPSLTRRQICSFMGTALGFATVAKPLLLRAVLPIDSDRLAFIKAVQVGDVNGVSAWLNKTPGLAKVVDEVGRSAFVVAHINGHDQIAKLLAEAGLEFDVIEAVLAEDWDGFGASIDADQSQLDALFPIGGTALYAAALVGSPGFWRIRERGAMHDLAPAGGSGFTPARGAMECVHDAWAQISLADLCSNGSDVNAPQKGGSSVLHGAVLRRDETLVRLAIRMGADVEAKTTDGKTPIDLAIQLNWQAGVKLLRGHKSLPRDNRSSRFALDANREPIVRPDLSGVPAALQREVTSNSHFNLSRVRELIAKDKRLVFSISGDDELAIEACGHVGNAEIMRYYLDLGAPLSLPTAVSLGDLNSVTAWLESNPDLVHERGAHDFPLMWYVVMGGGSLEMAERLASFGVPVDQESVGATALHQAIGRGQVELVDWLLQHEADPEAVSYNSNWKGDTPLGLATAANASKIIQLLKTAGARR